MEKPTQTPATVLLFRPEERANQRLGASAIFTDCLWRTSQGRLNRKEVENDGAPVRLELGRVRSAASLRTIKAPSDQARRAMPQSSRVSWVSRQPDEEEPMPRKSVAAMKHERSKAKVEETKRRSDANRAVAPTRKPAARSWDLATLDQSSEEFGAEMAKLNEELTVKQIAEKLGWPAASRSWRVISLAMRAWKDANGIARPGHRTGKPVKAPSLNGGKPTRKAQPARRKVSLAEMTDEEVTAAIEGHTVTYNYSASPGTDLAFVAKVAKYHPGRGGERVVTFWDHVSPPSAAEVKAEAARAREEKRDPKELLEHADGNIRSLYVSQIVSIGKR